MTEAFIQGYVLPSMQINLQSPLAAKIRKQMVEALAQFTMLAPADRVLVCVSGGKDSSILLALLKEVQRKAAFDFEIEAAILDQGHPGFEVRPFQSFVENDLGVKLHILTKDTYSIVKEKVTSGVYCSLCSRLRRGILYTFAAENKFTKLAMGHHRDDLIETLLMNLFYTGKTATMPPKLLSDDKRNILIRPLAFVPEKELTQLAQEWAFPVIPCNLCGSQDGMKRQKIKALVKNLEIENPSLGNSILGAMGNIHVSQMLDQSLWSFNSAAPETIEDLAVSAFEL